MFTVRDIELTKMDAAVLEAANATLQARIKEEFASGRLLRWSMERDARNSAWDYLFFWSDDVPVEILPRLTLTVR